MLNAKKRKIEHFLSNMEMPEYIYFIKLYR